MKFWMAPHGLHVELAEPEDASALAKIHADSFYRGWSEDELRTYINQPQTHPTYIVCDKDRQISGFMILRLVADESELLTIAVAKRWRGKGVGEALLRAGLDDIIKSPAKSMFLEVEEGNEPAVRLYRRFGFESLNRREAYYDHGTHTRAAALVMRYNLN